MTIKPLHSKVLIQRDAAPTQTSSGIQLISDGSDIAGEGTVLAIGPDVTEVNVGDRVVFGKYSGQSVVTAEPNKIIMAETDIFMVLEA